MGKRNGKGKGKRGRHRGKGKSRPTAQASIRNYYRVLGDRHDAHKAALSKAHETGAAEDWFLAKRLGELVGWIADASLFDIPAPTYAETSLEAMVYVIEKVCGFEYPHLRLNGKPVPGFVNWEDHARMVQDPPLSAEQREKGMDAVSDECAKLGFPIHVPFNISMYLYGDGVLDSPESTRNRFGGFFDTMHALQPDVQGSKLLGHLLIKEGVEITHGSLHSTSEQLHPYSSGLIFSIVELFPQGAIYFIPCYADPGVHETWGSRSGSHYLYGGDAKSFYNVTGDGEWDRDAQPSYELVQRWLTPLSADALVLTSLTNAIFDRSRRYIIEGKTGLAGDMYRKKHAPGFRGRPPPPLYLIKIANRILRRKVRGDGPAGFGNEPTHQKKIGNHERVRIKRGPLPISKADYEDLRSRSTPCKQIKEKDPEGHSRFGATGWHVYTDDSLTSLDYDRLMVRGLNPRQPDEWLALLPLAIDEFMWPRNSDLPHRDPIRHLPVD